VAQPFQAASEEALGPGQLVLLLPVPGVDVAAVVALLHQPPAGVRKRGGQVRAAAAAAAESAERGDRSRRPAIARGAARRAQLEAPRGRQLGAWARGRPHLGSPSPHLAIAPQVPPSCCAALRAAAAAPAAPPLGAERAFFLESLVALQRLAGARAGARGRGRISYCRQLRWRGAEGAAAQRGQRREDAGRCAARARAITRAGRRPAQPLARATTSNTARAWSATGVSKEGHRCPRQAARRKKTAMDDFVHMLDYWTPPPWVALAPTYPVPVGDACPTCSLPAQRDRAPHSLRMCTARGQHNCILLTRVTRVARRHALPHLDMRRLPPPRWPWLQSHLLATCTHPSCVELHWQRLTAAQGVRGERRRAPPLGRRRAIPLLGAGGLGSAARPLAPPPPAPRRLTSTGAWPPSRRGPPAPAS
jgi:hypothetical protein